MEKLTFKTGTYPELITEADKLRQEVFIDEQNVPCDEVFDGMNEKSVHFVAFDKTTPVATARATNNDGSWRIGLVAVKNSRRGERLGEKIMHEAISHIFSCKGHEILLAAQLEVKRFYERLGFVHTKILNMSSAWV